MADKWGALWLIGSDMLFLLAQGLQNHGPSWTMEPVPKGKLVKKTHKREEKQEQKQKCQELSDIWEIF